MRVFEHDALGHLFAELSSEQRPQAAHAIARLDPRGNIAAIEVASKREHMLACHLENMINMTQHIIPRWIDVRIAQKIPTKIKPHDTAALGYFA